MIQGWKETHGGKVWRSIKQQLVTKSSHSSSRLTWVPTKKKQDHGMGIDCSKKEWPFEKSLLCLLFPRDNVWIKQKKNIEYKKYLFLLFNVVQRKFLFICWVLRVAGQAQPLFLSYNTFPCFENRPTILSLLIVSFY